MEIAVGCAAVAAATAALRARSAWRAHPRVSSLHVFPVKGMRGHAVQVVELDEHGIVDDRRFLVVDSGDRFVTQRTAPAMATLVPAVEAGAGAATLVISRDGDVCSAAVPPLRVAVTTSADVEARRAPAGARLRRVHIWGSEVDGAVDQGDAAAAWLAAALGVPGVRLVYMDGRCVRPIDDSLVDVPGRTVAWSDGFPLLLLGDASVAAISDSAAAPVPADRYRANVMVANAPPFAEDTWLRVTVGPSAVPLAGVKRCSRCRVTTTDQRTGAVPDGPPGAAEPLLTLRRLRANADGAVFMGVNIVHEWAALAGRARELRVLRVGDVVTPTHIGAMVPA